jgi:hypothetical protein
MIPMWIELHDTIREHRKTYALAAELKVPNAHAVGLLACLWLWSFTNAPDGDLSGFPARAIAQAAGWQRSPGVFLRALETCGWVDRDGDRLTIHDWIEYAQMPVMVREAEREKTRKRVERYRQRKRAEALGCNGDGNVTVTADCNGGNVTTVPNLTKPNLTLGYDARAGEEKSVGTGASSPGNGAPKKEVADGEGHQGHPGQHPGHPGPDRPDDREPTIEERMREHARQLLENGGPPVYPF